MTTCEQPWCERAKGHRGRCSPVCTCPSAMRPLGKVEGTSMGIGLVRLSTDPRCPTHGAPC